MSTLKIEKLVELSNYVFGGFEKCNVIKGSDGIYQLRFHKKGLSRTAHIIYSKAITCNLELKDALEFGTNPVKQWKKGYYTMTIRCEIK